MKSNKESNDMKT